MLAACKAAFSGLSPSTSGGGGRSSPSEKQIEAFVRALSDCQFDQVAAHVAESRLLLVSPLKCQPARCSAWHLAAAAAPRSGNANGELLQLLLRLYSEQELPMESLADLLNAPNKRGQSCLHCAAEGGNAAAIRLLLSLGCELLRADKSGRTALHYAAAVGSEECVRLLLAMAEAEDVRTGGTEGAAAAMQEGSDGRAPSPPPSPPLPPLPQQQHPRQAAAGSLVVRLVTATDVTGLTPLHFAAAVNSLPVIRLLLAAGSPYTAQTATDNLEARMPCNAGWTCLHVAAMRGHYDVVMVVLRHHLSLSAEQQVAGWIPGKNCRSSDPRVLLDRRGTSAHSLALSRGFVDLADLLNPDMPLSQSVLGSGPVGPDGQELQLPAMFVCPITQEMMRDPVVASDGFTYERAAIARWLAAGRRTSPMTNLPFASRLLFPNNVVKSAIKEWRQEHKLPDPDIMKRSARRLACVGLGTSVHDNNASGNGGGGGVRLGAGRGNSRDPFLSHLRSRGL
ncbi:hypothetical protein Vretimale_15302 [Volvox reticuliferus]|uniref:U-box domain-containing protein n=1 Tax=Volvox reticuliferus TaxID=1737510 RepID=A0A8J4CTX7_9CHLO|nr:hypothetical protein Vretifemale_16522 [Volvox reticuliferus]GIM11844.1 hypothetical protein Vretimale_15302 [Volvox reticuliferus]